MTRRVEPWAGPEAEERRGLRWRAAFKAGLFAGGVLLVVPRGSPWSSFTFFSPAVFGRILPDISQLPLPLVWAIQLCLAVLYAVAIAWCAERVGRSRAVFVGGVLGLLFYGLSAVVVSMVWPRWHEVPFPVVFTHVVFGLIAGGAYRGLRGRRQRVCPDPEAGS